MKFGQELQEQAALHIRRGSSPQDLAHIVGAAGYEYIRQPRVGPPFTQAEDLHRPSAFPSYTLAYIASGGS